MTQPYPNIFRVNLPKVDFKKELFDNLILERGTNVQWEKATICPCVRADTAGRTTFNCGDCYNGSFFLTPETILAVVTNITGQRNAAIYGEIAQGGIFLTARGDHRIAINDRVTLKDSTARYSEQIKQLPACKVNALFTLGATSITTDHTRSFPVNGSDVMSAAIGGVAFTYTGKTDTSLTGIPSTGAGSIMIAPPIGTVITAQCFKLRYLPLQFYDLRTTGTSYVFGVDYEQLNAGIIHFLSPGAAPAAAFTCLYDSYPVYLVDSLSHEYRDQLLHLGYVIPDLARLPVAAVCRKDFQNRAGA